MQSNLVTAHACIVSWGSILKSDGEAERVAVMLDALGYVADDKYSCGPYHRRMLFSHRVLRSRVSLLTGLKISRNVSSLALFRHRVRRHQCLVLGLKRTCRQDLGSLWRHRTTAGNSDRAYLVAATLKK